MKVLGGILLLAGLAALYTLEPVVRTQVQTLAATHGLEPLLPERWLTVATAQAARLLSADAAPAPKYILAPVRRGDIATTVAASGTLSAISTVLVSSQVSGQMLRILADYNAEVQKGEIIAEIDPLSFQIAVEQAQSQLAVAEAAVLIHKRLSEKAIFDLASAGMIVEGARFATERERIAMTEAGRDVERKRSLGANISLVDLSKTQAVLDTAIQNHKAADAEERTKISLVQSADSTRRSAEAQVAHAQTLVQQRQSDLKAAQAQLERTKIRSPVNGVIIGRTIEEGQQVSVTLQTQTLFTIAQDLRDMRIKIAVDEADIGKIKVGQPVFYTVDSFPGRQFQAEVKQIRKDPQERQNVVTFIVIANASNPEKILMPGMTATARIVIDARQDIQKVPVAAMRFAPPGARGPTQSHLWTLGEDQQPKAVPVRVGLSDGTMVEVAAPEQVTEVIVGIEQNAAPSSLTRRIIGSI